jgi:hypothetical protein
MRLGVIVYPGDRLADMDRQGVRQEGDPSHRHNVILARQPTTSLRRGQEHAHERNQTQADAQKTPSTHHVHAEWGSAVHHDVPLDAQTFSVLGRDPSR